jgi:hypothetical protein
MKQDRRDSWRNIISNVNASYAALQKTLICEMHYVANGKVV